MCASRKTLTAGVPQGSLLSPALFSIFVSDMPTTPNTRTALYADDTAVLTSSLRPRFIIGRLQEAMDRLEQWFRTWRIEINAEKSTAILFTKRRHTADENVSIFGGVIPWRSEAKYLGVVMDQKLTWEKHVNACTVRAKKGMAALYPLLNRNSKLSTNNKLRIYTAVIRPTMTYASTAWGYAAPTHLSKLQVIQNRVLRMAFDAPWFVRNTQLHEEADIPGIVTFIKNSATKFYLSVQIHHNPLIQSLGDYDAGEQHRHKRPKMILALP